MESELRSGRVLLVDDEPTVCQLMNEALFREGYECRSCQSGEEALGLLKKEPFDVVIADLYMPGLSGMSLIEEGRKVRPESAFLMATGESDARVGVQAMKNGAVDYLVKPFPMSSLVASVRRAQESQRRTAEMADGVRHFKILAAKRRTKLQKALQKLNRAYEETIEMLGGVLDVRDNEAAGHAHRVSRYALEIAKRLDLPQEQWKDFVRGAFLHDIGKIGIPDEILLKPGKLTSEEMAVMRTHVIIGYNLLRNLDYLSTASAIVLSHHERYDSKGYPRGLKGSEIPLEARIFSLADTLDAITTDRPYRKARSFADARTEIIGESGRQFDPAIVKAFLCIPEEAWQNIREEIDARMAKGRWTMMPLPWEKV
jgi:putative nucleotidyltransferase with HDIG domain